MKIGVLTNEYPPQLGGVGECAHQSARALLEMGNDVRVIVVARESGATDEDVPPVWRALPEFPRRASVGILGWLASLLFFPIAALRAVFSVASALRSWKIDVLVIHFPMEAGYYGIWLGKLTGAPIVVHVHGWEVESFADFPWWRRFPVTAALTRASLVLSNSDYLRAKTAVVLPDVEDRIVVVGNGVDLLRREADRNTAVRLIDDNYVFAYGRFVEKKGFDVLLRAHRLADTGQRLVLAGAGPEEPYYRELARELGIAERVLFWGRASMKEVTSLLAFCTFCVVPSRAEPFGIVVLEAMAVGAAVIASRVGGIPELIEDGVTGLLVEADQPETLARVMEALSRDEQWRARLSSAARSRVRARWQWGEVAQHYAEAYTTAARRCS